MERETTAKGTTTPHADDVDWLILRGVPVRLGKGVILGALAIHLLGWVSFVVGVWMIVRHLGDIKLLLGK